ncbi:Conserved_hypothetical protein [Hexamita inflata]|uniref:Transmembrane protein n=1 Tax=Hexamita inflata TaxID=28002 RepID=A0AA86RDH0_9EUKA|nr:Conserved hypothetical protein [Hexamita inflata]
MITIIYSLFELTRLEKKTMYNCFTTSADINLFADTLQITVTLTSTKSASCDIPHGVFVSLQIDSLGSYEPSAYVQDFAYDSPQQIRLACTDPVECAKLKAAESGTIVLETKTHATFVPAGSIRVSKGLSSSCFHDNDSFVELYQGAVVLVLYPTFTCKDSIATDNLGQLKLNTLSKVKMYISYTDTSVTIHDQLTITVQQDLFIPTSKVSASSTPVKIKLENPTISKFFIQNISANGTLSKDMVLFQANIEYLTSDATPLKKNVQVTMNTYKFMGILSAYSKFDLQLLQNGFISLKVMGPQSTAANNQLKALGVTSYTIQYIFTTYDVTKTEQFRMRLYSTGTSNYLYNANPTQNTCEVRFPGQNCQLLLQKLDEIDVTELSGAINYQYYKNDALITNYTKKIDNIYDSCFSDGLIDYDSGTQITTIHVNTNPKAKFCSLAKNDALIVKILLGNNSQVLKTFNHDFIPGKQQFQISGFNLTLLPEIRVQYFRSTSLLDAVAISKYVVYKDSQLIKQEIHIVLYVLTANLVFALIYLTWYFFALPSIKACLDKKKSIKTSFKQFADNDIQEA